ncbi:MAG: hypothetical protein ACRYFS_24395 [Janthinobacterium lividum]
MNEELDNLLFWTFLRGRDRESWLATPLAPFCCTPQQMLDGGEVEIVLILLRRKVQK